MMDKNAKELKRETNLKSAVTAYGLAGLLGVFYIVRYFIRGNFDYYFSLSFTELVLRLGDSGKLPLYLGYIVAVLYAVLYIAVLLMMNKSPSKIKLGLGIYLFDFICLVPLWLVRTDVQSDFFIDVIVHLFVIVFLVVGVRSIPKVCE